MRAGPMLAIGATFTAEPLGEPLGFWMQELGYALEPVFAPYGQVFQTLLDPAGLFAHNPEGVNALLIRFEDWARGEPDRSGENARELVRHIRDSARPAPLLVCLCPPSAGFEQRSRALEELVVTGLKDCPSVHVLDSGWTARLYPVEQIHDPHADELGHVPYTAGYFAALATAMARLVHALRTLPFKVAAVDCDDTLWSGICGEDGPGGVTVDPGRRALQEFLREQRGRGMLLALCSKNNPEDVFDTFRVHPEMVLALEDFAAWRINWEPKSTNLAALATELELGLDSFLLVDDNPKECAEVEANRPEVAALLLPAEPASIPQFLEHLWAFDRLAVTDEDRRRAAMYSQRAERNRAARQAATLQEFVASLDLDIRIAPAQSGELARVAQLTQRTNQMNFSNVRRTEGEIREMLESGQAECLAVRVSDRFGDYGLVGVLLYRQAGGALVVDTFLLSCRALGRGVEHRMVNELGRAALSRGLARVEAPFVRSQRNLPALLFLESAGSEPPREAAGQVVFVFPASHAAQLQFRPGTRSAGTAPQPPPAATRKRIDYQRIATELRRPERVLELARPRREPLQAPDGVPRTELERGLADIWRQTLNLPAIGIHDNFFDLGGHSLLAVELLARVRRELNADVSLDVVYGGDFTVAELARAIELKEIERADPEEFGALLREVDALSDEEVRQLLDSDDR